MSIPATGAAAPGHLAWRSLHSVQRFGLSPEG